MQQAGTSTDRRAGERFPVASLLIARNKRAVTLACYRLIRAADDLADDPALPAGIRLRQLQQAAAVLLGHDGGRTDSTADGCLWPLADRLRTALQEAGLSPAPVLTLLDGFAADLQQTDMLADDAALWHSCAATAVPVGHFLLDLHGEASAARQAADPLCRVLQILNHLSDCKTDWQQRQRCYLPADRLHRHGVMLADLSAARCPARLRQVLNEMLDGCATDLQDAFSHRKQIRSLRLRAEFRLTLAFAQAHLQALRRSDPLAGEVRPQPLQVIRYLFLGAGHR